MRVFLLAGDVFEARDLGRALGLNVRDTVILHSEAATKLQHPADGDLIIQTATAHEHPEHEKICEILHAKVADLDVRWETEPT